MTNPVRCRDCTGLAIIGSAAVHGAVLASLWWAASSPAPAQAPADLRGQEVALDFSVVLDDTLGRERVTALFCPEVFDIERVQSALSSGSALPEPLARCERVGFEINKHRAAANP